MSQPQTLCSSHLQVIGLWDIHGLQGDSGQDQMGALGYPSLGCPVEGGPLHPWLLELWESERVQVDLWEFERDRSGGFVEASVRSGNPAIQIKA